MGGYTHLTQTKNLPERFKIVNGKKKLVTLLICVNLVIIGGYFICPRRSTANFAVATATIGNKNGLDKKHHENNHEMQIHEIPKSDKDNQHLIDQSDYSEDGTATHAPKTLIKKTLMTFARSNSDVENGGSSLETVKPIKNKQLSSEFSSADEEDEAAFVHSPAFPSHKKPAALLNWTPAPDSAKYFQPIDHDKGWVFSAYFQPADTIGAKGKGGSNNDDDVEGPSVRLMVMTFRQVKHVLYCQFYSSNGAMTAAKKARRRSMKDRQMTRYGPFYMECPVPPRKMAQPHFVSLTTDPENAKPTNYVKVHYPAPRIRNFTVCLSPLHSNYNFTGQLIETFEFNRLLGAEHFTVYNFSVSTQTDAILRYYVSKGLATIIQWRLPNLEMWYYGQILAVNDCIYRNRGASKYVVVTDTDEIIIPHIHRNWSSLIENVNMMPSLREDVLSQRVLNSISRHTSNIHANSPFGGWSFRCAFYADKRLEVEELLAMKDYEFTLNQKKFLFQFASRRMLSLKRMDDVFDHGIKSKTILKPECVDVGSVHIVPSFKPGFQMAYVKPNTAMLHHYRDFKKMKYYNTLDTSALRFKDQYLERLKNTLMKFPNLFPTVTNTYL